MSKCFNDLYHFFLIRKGLLRTGRNGVRGIFYAGDSLECCSPELRVYCDCDEFALRYGLFRKWDGT